MTVLRLNFVSVQVDCINGYTYPLTERIEIACMCKEHPNYIWEERTETTYNKETQEQYNLITIRFGNDYTDNITFAVPYIKPAIYPDRITNAN